MRSSTPKVLHPLCGRPMVLHVVDALGALSIAVFIIIGIRYGIFTPTEAGAP